ncbi:MAG: hypothetical protein AB1656_01035 [Candidatus Omnitrophota bacterium]
MTPLVEGVQQFLIPFLGEAGAKKLILTYCSKHNKQITELTPQDLNDLGKHLFSNLTLIVGREKSEAVIKKLMDKSKIAK